MTGVSTMREREVTKSFSRSTQSSRHERNKHENSPSTTGNMTVAELEQASGVPAHVIRYYTRIGLLIPDRDPRNGYKLFRDHQVSRLAFIRQAKSLGFSLKEITEICCHAEKGNSPCPRVREIVEKRIDDNRKKLDASIGLQIRMEKAVRKWKRMPDGVPIGDTVCYLIESFHD